MKQIYSLCIFIAFCLILCSCEDERPIMGGNLNELIKGEPVSATLNVSVANHEVKVQGGSRALNPDQLEQEKISSEEENRIDNIWVFQFNASGTPILEPIYLTIEEQNQLKKLDVELTKDPSSTIYVVANTNEEWGKTLGLLSRESLQAATIPDKGMMFPKVKEKDVELSIPMEGCVEEVEVTKNSDIEVRVIRMYAKLKINIVYGGEVEGKMMTRSLGFRNLPDYCPIQATLKDDVVNGINIADVAHYPDNTSWYVDGLNTEGDGQGSTENSPTSQTYIAYVPENIQGEVDNPSNEERKNLAPSHAMAMDITVKTDDGSNVTYTIYPGKDMQGDFSVIRNHVYYITVNINNFPQQEPSSNCFVVAPGQEVSFWPYIRDEVGGDYNISTYLNPDPNKSDLNIYSVEILWQTTEAIGDNSDHDKVWITGEGMDTKIHVKANKEGNAVIAAYNKNGKIVWSWHIWVTKFLPDNVGNQVNYWTLIWDNIQIYQGRRSRGLPVMRYNLGAFSDKNEVHEITGTKTKAFGLLYQWGRKDPFPPLRGDKGTFQVERMGRTMPYTEDYTEPLYNNAHKREIGMVTSAQTKNKEMFWSLKGNNRTGLASSNPILYTIQNPTVFMCGTQKAREVSEITDLETDHQSYTHESYIYYSGNYSFKGDWANFDTRRFDGRLRDKHERWGAYEAKTTQKHLQVAETTTGEKVYIHDNYGPKSIFDPCPRGWMIPPGELWLGFTWTGKNPDAHGIEVPLGSDVNWEFPELPENADQMSIAQKNDWLDENYFDVYGPGLYMYMQGWKPNSEKLYFPTQGTRAPDGYGFRVGSCGNYPNSTTEANGRVNTLHLHPIFVSSWEDSPHYKEFTNEAFMIFEIQNFFYYAKSTGSPVRCVRDIRFVK